MKICTNLQLNTFSRFWTDMQDHTTVVKTANEGQSVDILSLQQSFEDPVLSMLNHIKAILQSRVYDLHTYQRFGLPRANYVFIQFLEVKRNKYNPRRKPILKINLSSNVAMLSIAFIFMGLKKKKSIQYLETSPGEISQLANTFCSQRVFLFSI